MGTHELKYPHAEHPAPGTTVELAPGVRWLTMPMGGSLNHINLYLLEDTTGWWIVDTGLSLDQTRELWHEIFSRELQGRPVIGVICTHFHPDHIGQSKMITDEFRCSLYMTRAEYYQARAFSGSGPTYQSSWLGETFYQRAGMPADYLEQLREMWAHRSSEGMSMPDMPAGYRRLEDGDVLTIGGHDWRIVVGSGHSPEHACLYCAALKIMISGDQILPVITSNVSVHPTEPEANPLKDWMESHDRFLRVPDDTLVLPAHNLPFYGVRERLRQLIDHHEDRMLAIEEHCVEPAVAKDLLPVLFARELDPRQMMMALGEAIAHLHLLVHRNRIERTLHEDGCYRFLSIDPDLKRRAHPGDHDAPSERPVLV
jgi:glyoxylase-like metal-dependent hydrolase (beta-lactamase superfamily II)